MMLVYNLAQIQDVLGRFAGGVAHVQRPAALRPRRLRLDGDLPGVLATTTDHEVHGLRQRLPGVVLVHDGDVPVPSDARGEAARVAQVPVDAHLAGVHVHEVDLALALVPGVGGTVGVGGSTGAVLGRSLVAMRTFVDSGLADRCVRILYEHMG